MDYLADQIFTKREMDIVALVAVGLSAKIIGRRFSIAPRTVERHIENARIKTNARNRTHLVSYALIYGLLSVSLRAELLLASTRGDIEWPDFYT